MHKIGGVPLKCMPFKVLGKIKIKKGNSKPCKHNKSKVKSTIWFNTNVVQVLQVLKQHCDSWGRFVMQTSMPTQPDAKWLCSSTASLWRWNMTASIRAGSNLTPDDSHSKRPRGTKPGCDVCKVSKRLYRQLDWCFHPDGAIHCCYLFGLISF